MAASASENLLLAGAGFLVIACIFFILINFVFSVKIPQTNTIFAPFSSEISNETRIAENNGGKISAISNYSVLWIALLCLSIVVVLIGARLVWLQYGAKGQ